MEKIEIERRWLISNTEEIDQFIIDEVDSAKQIFISQHYLPDNNRLRISMIDDGLEGTVNCEIINKTLQTSEKANISSEVLIKEVSFNEAMEIVDNGVLGTITKIRAILNQIDDPKYTGELVLDAIFFKNGNILVIAEKEFNKEDDINSYVLPDLLNKNVIKEITNDNFYSNRNIAINNQEVYNKLFDQSYSVN